MNKMEIRSNKILLTCLSEENFLRILVGADKDPSQYQEGLIQVNLVDDLSDIFAKAWISAHSIELDVDHTESQ